MSNKLVIFFGPPGSGKGTQSFLLAEHEGMYHLEASKSLNAKMHNASPGEVVSLGEEKFSIDEQKRRWEEGLLCEDGFVAHVIKERLKELKEKGESIIIDGYPRSIKQIEGIISFIKETFSEIIVYYITVDEEDSIYRNTNRKVCQLMGHSIVAHPETLSLTICPVDGSPLKKRDLDDPEVIKIRLEEFKKRSLPVIDYLKENDILVKEIDGKGSISEVFSRILNA